MCGRSEARRWRGTWSALARHSSTCMLCTQRSRRAPHAQGTARIASSRSVACACPTPCATSRRTRQALRFLLVLSATLVHVAHSPMYGTAHACFGFSCLSLASSLCSSQCLSQSSQIGPRVAPSSCDQNSSHAFTAAPQSPSTPRGTSRDGLGAGCRWRRPCRRLS